MTKKLIQEIDNLRAEIQQLKEANCHLWHCNQEIKKHIEDAKTILNQRCTECMVNKICEKNKNCAIKHLKEVLAGETTK